MRSVAAVALSLFAVVPLLAQEKLVESVEVRVVNVDVVVTDRAGKAVTGLTKDDFELFENGKPQTITNFYEITPERDVVIRTGTTESAPPAVVSAPAASASKPAAAPADLRARRFVFMLDNYSLQPVQRNRTLAALRKFIDTNMKSSDEAALLVWARKAEMITPLTNDKQALFKGIASVESRSRAGMTIVDEEDQTRKNCQQIMSEVDGTKLTWDQAWLYCKGEIGAFSDSVWMNNRAIINDLRSAVALLGGIDGRKVIVLAGAALPQNPGREIGIWATQQFMQHQDFIIERLNIAKAIGQAASRSQKVAISDVAKFANANGVAFYTIDAADSRDASSAASPEIADYEAAFNSFTDTAAAYKTLADVTGGATLSGTQNFDFAFETLARDLTTFYSLGYKPAEGTSAERKISVRAKKSGLTVRARQSYTPKSSDQEMNDRVVANLFHQPAQGEWPVKLTAKTPEKNGDRFNVPLTIALDPNITLIPQEKNLVGGFVLYIVVGTKDGAMSKVTKNARKIEIPSNAEADLRSKPMSFTLNLTVKPGDNIISVGVADQVSDATGFDRLVVSAQ